MVLVEIQKPPPEVKMTNPTELKYYEMKPEAELDLQLLADQGIVARIVPENQGVFENSLAVGPVKVFVAAEDLKEAQRIISGQPAEP